MGCSACQCIICRRANVLVCGYGGYVLNACTYISSNLYLVYLLKVILNNKNLKYKYMMRINR